MAPYAKAVIAVLGAVAVAVQSALSDGAFSQGEVINLVISAVTAFQVWLTANTPAGTFSWYAKAMTAGVLAALNLVISYLDGGLTQVEIVNLVLAAITAALVLLVPNTTPPPKQVVSRKLQAAG